MKAQVIHIVGPVGSGRVAVARGLSNLLRAEQARVYCYADPERFSTPEERTDVVRSVRRILKHADWVIIALSAENKAAMKGLPKCGWRIVTSGLPRAFKPKQRSCR